MPRTLCAALVIQDITLPLALALNALLVPLDLICQPPVQAELPLPTTAFALPAPESLLAPQDTLPVPPLPTAFVACVLLDIISPVAPAQSAAFVRPASTSAPLAPEVPPRTLAFARLAMMIAEMVITCPLLALELPSVTIACAVFVTIPQTIVWMLSVILEVVLLADKVMIPILNLIATPISVSFTVVVLAPTGSNVPSLPILHTTVAVLLVPMVEILTS